jgi:hypothetical protein
VSVAPRMEGLSLHVVDTLWDARRALRQDCRISSHGLKATGDVPLCSAGKNVVIIERVAGRRRWGFRSSTTPAPVVPTEIVSETSRHDSGGIGASCDLVNGCGSMTPPTMAGPGPDHTYLSVQNPPVLHQGVPFLAMKISLDPSRRTLGPGKF